MIEVAQDWREGRRSAGGLGPNGVMMAIGAVFRVVLDMGA